MSRSFDQLPVGSDIWNYGFNADEQGAPEVCMPCGITISTATDETDTMLGVSLALPSTNANIVASEGEAKE